VGEACFTRASASTANVTLLTDEVGEAVGDEVLVDVAELLGVARGVFVAVGEGPIVFVPVAVCVAAVIGDGVRVDVPVAVFVAVGEGPRVFVPVAVCVAVVIGDGVRVDVPVAVFVAVGVRVGEGPIVPVAVFVNVAVEDGVSVEVLVFVIVAVGKGVPEAVP
jgi:hypothetical protein